MPVKKLPKIEAQYQKPIALILTELYAELGDHQLVAARLGVTPKTLWQWRNEADCRTVVRIACDCEKTA